MPTTGSATQAHTHTCAAQRTGLCRQQVAAGGAAATAAGAHLKGEGRLLLLRRVIERAARLRARARRLDAAPARRRLVGQRRQRGAWHGGRGGKGGSLNTPALGAGAERRGIQVTQKERGDSCVVEQRKTRTKRKGSESEKLRIAIRPLSLSPLPPANHKGEIGRPASSLTCSSLSLSPRPIWRRRRRSTPS